MRHPAHTAFRTLLRLQWFLLLLVPSLLFAQGNIVRVVFEADSSRNTAMGVFERHGILYASLTDLAQIFSLTTYENHQAEKLEIKQPPYRVKVSGGNPFIVVTDSARQTVYQLPARVIYAARAFFVPLYAFVPFFNSVFNKQASFDPVKRTLSIGIRPAAYAYDIPSLSLETKSNGMVIRILSHKPLPDLESWLRPDGWLYVTVADAKADVRAIDAVKPVGIIKQIVAIQSPTSVQLTFKLAGKVAASEILHDQASNDVLVSIRTPGTEEKSLLENKRQEIREGLESQRQRWQLDAIVIDPGHGGRDWGAIGVSGVREKDVALAVGLKLGRLIRKNMKGVRVIYTRKDDTFVELDRRGQIANEEGGKLFISIHCNSLRRKPSPTRGFEVYLLRPGRTEEAIAIAERENAVIKLEEGYEKKYKELTDENFILVTMAQSAYVKASEAFADLAQHELEDVTGLENRGVKQAGFYVLVGAAMPNVLVETAYLSNRQDERFLKNPSGQEKIAEALFKAVKEYKGDYEKFLNEGKDLGENR